MSDEEHNMSDEEIYNSLTEEEKEEFRKIVEFANDPEGGQKVIKFFSDPANVTELFEKTAYNLINTINPDAIPAELLKENNIRLLAEQIHAGDIEGAKDTIANKITAGQFYRLREAFIYKEITRYKTVPVKVLNDQITRDLFIDQVPAGMYSKTIRAKKKVLAKIDYDLELSQAAEKTSVFEGIVIDAIYTIMKETNGKRITGDQLYKIITNDPDAKLTPRAIENMLNAIYSVSPITARVAFIHNVFDDPDAPHLEIYRQILKYDFLAIQRKADGTPKNFEIIMHEYPLTGVIAERLNQICSRPFGFYQLPRGKKATKKNLSLTHELIRHVDIRTRNTGYKDINLDDLMKKCGFDTTDRDETKKARDLIEATLKGREDNAKNRESHPERVIDGYLGYKWVTETRSGKRTHLKIIAAETPEKQGTRYPQKVEKRGTRHRETVEKRGTRSRTAKYKKTA